MLSFKDICIDATTTRLLNEAGRQDAEKGIDKYAGWKVVAAECGYDHHRRTPAEEAYLDGYFSYKAGLKPPMSATTCFLPEPAPKPAPKSAPEGKPKASTLKFTAAEQRVFEEALSQL